MPKPFFEPTPEIEAPGFSKKWKQLRKNETASLGEAGAEGNGWVFYDVTSWSLSPHFSDWIAAEIEDRYNL